MDREAWNQRYADAELVWSADANRFLVEAVTALPPGRALDLGAGEGRNAIWLAERGWRVTAVDFSAIGLQKARRLAEARGVEVNWTEADLRSYTPSRRAARSSLLDTTAAISMRDTVGRRIRPSSSAPMTSSMTSPASRSCVW